MLGSYDSSIRINVMSLTAELVLEIEGIAQNTDNIVWLADQIKNGSVTPFIGAGMSIPFGFAGWVPFLGSLEEIVGAIGFGQLAK